MNNQIKHLVEAFDFNSINKDKKHLNISDIVIKNILNKVAIEDKTPDDLITKDEYNILISFTGIYPVKDIKELKSILPISDLLFLKKLVHLLQILVMNVILIGLM